jgi:flagellar hook assembly protein FlgD
MSSVNNVTLNTSTAPTSTSTTATGGSQTLTQADFLKIMVAQFTQQDPLSSGDGSSSGSGTSDYVNQLMAMTNLTTMQTMSSQVAQQLAESLPGATVNISDNGVTSSGVVQSARLDTSTQAVDFTVGGKEYPISDLYSIQQTAAQAAAATTTTSTSSNGS